MLELFLFFTALPVLYQLLEYVAQEKPSLSKKEQWQLILIRFGILYLCVFIVFISDSLYTVTELLQPFTILVLIALAVVLILTMYYIEPEKPKHIRVLLYILSAILLFILCFNLRSALYGSI